MKNIKRVLNFLLNKFGLKIIRLKHYNQMSKYELSHRVLSILDFSGGDNSNISSDLKKYIAFSKSQLSQDLFVLTHLKLKRYGYFVEFGATNGVDLSNTWLLEKEFGWKGILAEPSKNWHADLSKNRFCNIEYKAVWIKSNEKLMFLEANVPELSTFSDFRNTDSYSRKGHTYLVETISLLDLLIRNDAPKIIDYLSIDTEGSELDILTNFDFEKYKFRVITVEHNFTINRQKINQLLTSKGFKQVLESVSSFDDWYILENI